MPTLTLKLKDNVLETYQVNSGYSLAIGRRTSNDIVIVNLAVSGYHADIVPTDDGFLLRDLDSKNGTLVNGKRITRKLLKHKDIIALGKHTLIFNDGTDTSSHEDTQLPEETLVFENPNEMHDQTVMIDTSKLPGASGGPPESSSRDFTGILNVLNQNKRIPLNKNIIKIGTGKDSDIRVPGIIKWFAGKTAATISRRPDGFYVSYIAGIIRPKINDIPLKGTRKLKGFDEIRIGSMTLQFLEKYTRS